MIDRTEKIGISEFEEAIQLDFSSREYARFPTRFILVESLRDWISVLKTLKRITEKTINLSEFCKSPQNPPDINEAVRKAIEEVKIGKRILFVSFSEYMRFFENYEHFLAILSNIQIDPQQNGRIYVPLLFSKTKFQVFWNKIPLSEFQSRRKSAIEIIPSAVEDMRIYVTNMDDISEFSGFIRDCLFFKSYQDYLEFFERTLFPEHMIKLRILLLSYTISKILKDSKLEDPTVNKIENYKSFLEHFFDVKISIPYKEEEKSYWKKLTEDFLSRKSNEFEEFLRSYFNVKEFLHDIFSKWQRLDDFGRWLLFNWGKMEVKGNAELGKKYLGQVLSSCENFNELEKQIWLKIFEITDPKKEIFEERRKLIESMSTDPPKDFFEKIYEIKNPEIRIKYLTSTSFEEKKEIVKNFAELIDSGKDLGEILPLIENSYPELYHYLSFPPVDLGYDLIKEYFTCYNIAKVTNEFKKYETRLSEIAGKINVFDIKPRNEIIEKIAVKKIFVDGMGLEWLGLIYHHLKNRGYEIDFHIARSVIPTTSEFNRVPEDSIQFKELDLIFHRQDLEYPDYLVKEIEILKEGLNDFERQVKEYGAVILTSDHGSTRFSGWPEERIEPTVEFEIERNGRYAKTKEIPPKSQEYEIELINGQYFLISKTHKVFKGGKRTKVENHGGATLEEVLIPVVKISEAKPKKRKIVLLDKEITILKPVFRIRTPQPISVPFAIILDKRYEAIKEKDDVWKFDLRQANLKPGIIKAEIRVDGEVHEIEIKIKGGMEEEELL